ncbi:MAG: hypothetical protein ACWA5U_09630 [bacterium]
MDEDQYRHLYQEINQTRCIYEKALNNRRCDCSQKMRFLLATREGVGCRTENRVQRCTRFLDTLREKSRFALKEITIDGPLPHNKELRVQAGGCQALQTVLRETLIQDYVNHPDKFAALKLDPETLSTQDIDHLLESAIAYYGDIDQLPYGELVKGVLRYKIKERRNRK